MQQEAKPGAPGAAAAPQSSEPPPGIASDYEAREYEGLLADVNYADAWGNT